MKPFLMALVAAFVASFTLVSSAPAEQWSGEIWHGQVQSVSPPNVQFKRSDGNVVTVNVAQVHPALVPALAPGDMVTFAMTPAGPPNQYVARLLLPDKLYMAEGDRQWQRLHGHVQAVQGQSLTFRTDDGRTLNVDMRQVAPEIQQAMRPGVWATVVGFPGQQPNQMEARYIQQDASDPGRGGVVVGQPGGAPAPPPAAGAPAASPPAPPPPGAGDWQRVEGTVQGMRGAHLVFQADDGRQMAVDVTKVDPAVRAALKPGTRVTLVGFPRGQDFTAHYIQQQGAAASPRTGR